MKLRVYLADDHPIVRDGLRLLVEAQRDMEVVGEAEDGARAISEIVVLGPDVAVVDVSMPLVGGAGVTEHVRRHCPKVRVLALSAYEDPGYVQQMLGAGAAGYVVKRAAADELIRAIRTVASGHTYLDPAIAGGVVERSVQHRRAGAESPLSDRETEVLKRIALGHAMKEIAAALDVAVRTVETYRARAMEKTGLKTRADIVRFVAERGWLNG